MNKLMLLPLFLFIFLVLLAIKPMLAFILFGLLCVGAAYLTLCKNTQEGFTPAYLDAVKGKKFVPQCCGHKEGATMKPDDEPNKEDTEADSKKKSPENSSEASPGNSSEASPENQFNIVLGTEGKYELVPATGSMQLSCETQVSSADSSTQYSSCYQPSQMLRGVATSEGALITENRGWANYGGFDERVMNMNRERGNRNKKAMDGWASKTANHYASNFGREIEQHENKSWWGRYE